MNGEVGPEAAWWVCPSDPGQLQALSGLGLHVLHSPEGLAAAWVSRRSPPQVLLLATEHTPSTGSNALAQESAWRDALHAAHIPYQTVWPDDGSHAAPVRRLMGLSPTPARRLYNPWPCEDCSDPGCEHRLFQDLIAQRQVTGG